jgi:cell division septation protein DedD
VGPESEDGLAAISTETDANFQTDSGVTNSDLGEHSAFLETSSALISSGVTKAEVSVPNTTGDEIEVLITKQPPDENWPTSMRYTVQVNSFISEKEAEKHVETLKARGYDAFTMDRYVAEKGFIFHRVYVGKYENYTSARNACDDLKKDEFFSRDIHVVNQRWAFGG